jgi:hypothetical protein
MIFTSVQSFTTLFADDGSCLAKHKNLKTLILLFNVALINGSLSDFLWYNSKIRRKMWKFYKYQFQDFFTIPLNLEIENIKELKEFLFEQFFILYDLKTIEIENKFPGLFNQIQKIENYS